MTDTHPNQDQITQVFLDYRNGYLTQKEAIQRLTTVGDFMPEVAKIMLANMRRHNVRDIRGKKDK